MIQTITIITNFVKRRGVKLWVIFVCALVIFSSGCNAGAFSERRHNKSAGGSEVASILALPPGGWSGSPVSAVRILVPANAGRVSWSPQGEIAFSLFDHMVGGILRPNIYIMTGNGADRRCVTCNNTEVPHVSDDVPVFSPNGKFIVFEGEDPSLGFVPSQLSQGGAGFDNNLWAITPNGKYAWQLTNIKRGEAVLHPQFSPNGTELAWAGYDRTSPLTRGYWDIHTANFMVNADGVPHLDNERVYRPGSATSSTFYETHVLTSNNRLFFSSNMDSPYETTCPACALGIWSWDVGSNEPPSLLTPNTSSWNEHAALASSGHIAWVTSEGEKFIPTRHWQTTLRTDWWLMSSDGQNKQRITYFNTSGHEQDRVICADSSWNAAGTQLVGTVDVITPTGSTTVIIVLGFNSPQ